MLREYGPQTTDQAPPASQGGALPPPAERYPAIISNSGARPSPLEVPPPAMSAFLVTIERLGQLVDQETRELRSLKPVDLGDFNTRKSQGLLEMSRAIRGLGDAARDERVEVALTDLRGKLEVNHAVLRMHLRAAQEVTAIISRAIQDAESDGTYSAAAGNKGSQSC